MAFNPDEYLKEQESTSGGFNPDSYLQEDDSVSEVESLGRGALNAATAGFSDELGGLLQSGLDKVFGGISDTDEELKAQGFTLPSNKTVYEQARDENRELDRKAQEANPVSYGVGEFGGAILPSLLTGGAATAGNLGRMAAVGAGQSAVDSLGRSEGENIAEIAEDTAIGGGVGGIASAALPPALKAAGKLVTDVPKNLALNAGEFLAKRTTKGVRDNYEMGTKGLKTFGDEANESVKEMVESTAKDYRNKAVNKYKEAGTKIGRILKDSDADTDTMLANIEQRIMNDDSLTDEGKSKLASLFNRYKKTRIEEEVTPGIDIAEDRLAKQLEKRSGRDSLLNKQSTFSEPELTEDVNFLQRLNTELKPDGTEGRRNVTQVAVPDDKIIENKIREFSGTNLGEMDELRRELGDILYNKNMDPTLARDFKSAYSEIGKSTKDAITPDHKKAFEDAYSTRSSMKEMRDISPKMDIDNLANDEKSFTKVMEFLTGDSVSSDVKRRQMNEIVGIGPVQQGNIDLMRQYRDVVKKNTGLRDASHEAWTLGGAIRAVQNVAPRVANYVGRMKNMTQGQTNRLAEEMNKKGLNSFADQLLKITPENKNKVIFNLSQQPAFRQALQELGEEMFTEDNEF